MATEKIWRAFQQQLLGFIKKQVNNPVDAEDILQEIFIKIHLHAANLTHKDKLSSWVYRITRNTIVDFYRKQKKTNTVELLELSLANEEEEKQLVCTKCLLPMVYELPPKYKDAFIQTEIEGLSQKQYAEQNGLSYSGAKSRVQRAKNKLQALFVSCCGIVTDPYGNVIEGNCSCDEEGEAKGD
ncbi:RNA polymerase sigma factor SigZ [Aureispira anguillae]|uniref:RNA polymerase sigma factor SigZ n=1 Tax=Aureispira anguillae TaxID=2864201 RepID=A0A915VMP4_9BACT|nr:RNA polymerase sigma factor SigZ [Aureispira anguillae]BDS09459.1 RNA polymerase sigma factor SigZ [Aureispira anguillae]